MSEMRLVVIASLAGDPESLIEEQVFPYEETGEGATTAALAAAKWLHEQADLLIQGATS